MILGQWFIKSLFDKKMERIFDSIHHGLIGKGIVSSPLKITKNF